MVQSFEAGTFGNVPEEEGRSSKDHDDQESKKEEEEVLHCGELTGLPTDEKQKSPVVVIHNGAFEKLGTLVGATEVAAVLGADLDDVALLDEKRDLHGHSGFEDGGLGGVVGGVTLDPLGGLGDFEFDRIGKIDGDGISLDEKDLDELAFLDEVLGISHKSLVDADGFVGVGVHEVVGSGLGVGELELLAVGFDNVHLFTGSEADGLGLAGFEGTDGRRDEGVSFSRGAVLKSENDAALSFVLDALPAFEVGCDDCHDGEGVREGERLVKWGVGGRVDQRSSNFPAARFLRTFPASKTLPLMAR